EVGVGLAKVLALGGHVAVMKTVERRAELLHELEGDAHALDRHVHRIAAVLPRPPHGAGAERVRSGPAQRVPVRHRKAQVLLHCLAADFFLRVVMAKGERVGGARALVTDFLHVEVWHDASPWIVQGWNVSVTIRMQFGIANSEMTRISG